MFAEHDRTADDVVDDNAEQIERRRCATTVPPHRVTSYVTWHRALRQPDRCLRWWWWWWWWWCVRNHDTIVVSSSRPFSEASTNIIYELTASWQHLTWTVITSAKEVTFASFFVCLFVSNFAQKLPNGFAWNFQERLVMGQWANY